LKIWNKLWENLKPILFIIIFKKIKVDETSYNKF
jgi:hypothetical protein